MTIGQPYFNPVVIQENNLRPFTVNLTDNNRVNRNAGIPVFYLLQERHLKSTSQPVVKALPACMAKASGQVVVHCSLIVPGRPLYCQ